MDRVTRNKRSGHIGVDVGATLSKIAHRSRPEDAPHFEFLPSANLELVADHVAAHRPARVGLTGGGATRLSPMLQCESQRVSEFDAWGNGATSFLAQMAEAERREPSFLLVSLGTGTSVLLVSGGTATRIGGTGLGGGTVLGLGAALTGGSTFEELCSLAVEGSAARVDLRVSDIYAPDEIPLAGDLTASNFGMLARDATSFWEACRWSPESEDWHDALTTYRGYGSYRISLCHGWASTPVDWIARHVMGIRHGPDGIRVNPWAPPGVSHLEGRAMTPHGPVEVRWRLTGERLQVEATGPAGIPLVTG